MDKPLAHYKSIHMIGIKGAGMAALAEILTKRGVRITGSDTDEHFFTDKILKRLGIRYQEGFQAENIPKKTEAIIYSSVYTPEKNKELKAAIESGLPCLVYSQAIGLLTREKMTLAVCGSHGKTTTSALLAETLKFAGKDPLALVGSRILSWDGSALSGSGEYFVLEADEYQDKLASYTPFGVILTSVDWDHPDFFPNVESYEAVFMNFIKRIPPQGFLIYCNDSAAVKRVADVARCRKISYGQLLGADYQVQAYQAETLGLIVLPHARRQTFSVQGPEHSLGEFELQLAGRHNALNAASVIALADALKLDPERVRTALAKFPGTERRLELVGERYGAPIYDDYAHHPEAIRATLLALRELYPERHIRAVFQPHTFSRTEALFTEFAQSFEDADSVAVLPIYTSAREAAGAVTSEELAALINRFFPGKATYSADADVLVQEMEESLGRQDVVIMLGAGIGWQVAEKLARRHQ